MVTRQVTSNAAEAEEFNEDELSDLLALIENDSLTVEREGHEHIALGTKGVPNGHYRRGDRIMQSFLNGLKSAGKYLSVFTFV